MTKVDAMRELWRALDFSSAEILQAALDAGADINAVHPEECLTALQYAVIGRRTGRRSIEILIAAGVDVNAATAEDLEKICCHMASRGTTSWLCSILTDTKEQTEWCIDQFKEHKKRGRPVGQPVQRGKRI